MPKCVRKLLPSAALLTFLGLAGCVWINGPPTVGPVDTSQSRGTPDPVTHTVVVSGDLSVAVFSPDTVFVHPGDQIVWLHQDPEAELIIHLDTLPVYPRYLEIPLGACGRVTVDPRAPVGDYKYDVTVILGEEGERFDPRVAVRARPSQDTP
jgi:hypothetical protein